MTKNPSFSKCFYSILGALLVVTLTVFYGIGHLGLGIPIREILYPYLVQLILSIPLPFLLFWAMKSNVESGGKGTWILLITAGVYGAAGYLVYEHYLLKFGIITSRMSWETYSLAVISLVLGIIGGHFLYKKRIL